MYQWFRSVQPCCCSARRCRWSMTSPTTICPELPWRSQRKHQIHHFANFPHNRLGFYNFHWITTSHEWPGINCSWIVLKKKHLWDNPRNYQGYQGCNPIPFPWGCTLFKLWEGGGSESLKGGGMIKMHIYTPEGQ